MTIRWTGHSTCCAPTTRRAGTTLIEVVAALALLSALVTAMLVARGRHMRQWSRAQRKLAAVEAADALLTQWRAQGRGVPVSDEGDVPQLSKGDEPDGLAPLRWKTHIVEQDAAARLGVRVVRLELFDDERQPDKPLTYVDVVVPINSAAEAVNER